MSSGSRMITVEQHKQLSKCLLWKMEREYFEKQGITAWLHDVPFYVTSNTFIAKAYARVCMYFVRDWIRNHPENRKHPFYFMETGTGPGRFSYFMVKVIEEMRRELDMEDVNIIYVMTDFAKANLEYHETHHALKPYMEKGVLDLAIHDMDKDTPIKLMHSGVELNQQTLVNPLVLFANYVFDTIPNDAFAVQNGKLYELLANISTEESNLKNNYPIELEKVTVEYTAKEIHGPYYGNPELDAVLDLYKNSLTDSSVLVPIGSIRGLDHLRKLANGKILLISSDKAYSDLPSLDHLGHPSLTIHGGCFSMMVNCHALGQYYKNGGGEFFPQSSRRGLKTCFYSTFSLADMPETRLAIADYIEKFSPADFFNIYRNMNETVQHVQMDAIASYLQLAEWDPQAYMRISARILEIINEADMDTVNFMADHMPTVASNYYYMPKADCVLFEVGVFFHAIRRYEQALEYYQKAEKFLGEQFGLKYNTALCLKHLERDMEALKYFKNALAIEPESKEAKEWVEYLEKTAMEAKYMPKGRIEDKGSEQR